jgi:hypothetical protein
LLVQNDADEGEALGFYFFLSPFISFDGDIIILGRWHLKASAEGLVVVASDEGVWLDYTKSP